MGTRDVEELLDAIELAEYPLLAWGITNASMTDIELRRLIKRVCPDGDDEQLKQQLLSRGLIFETPARTYRSRIAELLRLTLTLRQWISGNSGDANLLVHDIKFQLKQRSFPLRNLTPQNVIDSLREKIVDFDSKTLLPCLPEYLSEFQYRSVETILNAVRNNIDQSLVITAGTGSGKTNAFFIPVIHWLAAELKNGHVGTRVLALYPRNELLKDQLMNAILETRKINKILTEKSLTTIRIGVWYGDVPKNFSPNYFKKDLEKKNWKPMRFLNQNAWACPFLRCPTCPTQPNLLLLEDQVSKSKKVMRCPTNGCDFCVSSDEVVFTREELGNQASGCDILFSTTESVNRQLANRSGEFCFGLYSKSNLKIVLTDEAHLYEGLVGAQVAFLFRRIRNRVDNPLLWVALSATLEDPEEFIRDLVGIRPEVIKPLSEEMEYRGSEYSIAVRHYLESKASPLSSGIQLAMLLSRMLDPQGTKQKSLGLFGRKLFVFCDKHDLVYRFYYFLADAEGYSVPNGINRRKMPSSLATLRSKDQMGLPINRVEDPMSRYDSGQWWKASEDLGHPFQAASSKNIAITSSRETGVKKSADVVVATSSLEVGFDDQTVGAVIQYKMPTSTASLLQRKGRAGRTQMMRPLIAIVLSPYGRDRAAWTNAENSMFAPRVEAKRLPLSNRYTQKMQATYALLDWLHSHAGVNNTWNLLAHKFFKHEKSNNSISMLNDLLSNPNSQNEFARYLGKALDIKEPTAIREILWSQPRGILSVVVPLVLRRLETSYGEDAKDQAMPLPEFISGKLFEGLDLPEVSVRVPGAQTDQDDEDSSDNLRIQNALNEFMPGNISRRFSNKFWIPLPVGGRSVDVGATYSAMNTGVTVQVEGEDLPLYRPTVLNLENPPFGLTESTTAMPEWQKVLKTLGSPTEIITQLRIFEGQSIVIEAYLHSKGTNVLATRFVSHSRGWISKQNGDPERIDVDLVVGEQRVGLGFEVNVDGLRVSLKRPVERPIPSARERSERLLSLIKNDSYLSSIANPFDLEKVHRSLILLMIQNGGILYVINLGDSEFRQKVLNAAGSESIDYNFSNHDEDLKWFDQESVDAVKSHLKNVSGVRDADWNHWFDKRVFAALGALLMDAFRTIVPDLDSDDLILDVIDVVGDEEMIEIWITELSPGGSGAISRIVEELEVSSELDNFLVDLLKPREFERLDSDLRRLIEFSIQDGGPIADKIRLSWSEGLKATQISFSNFESAIEKNCFFPSRSALAVFFNRFLGPGSEFDLLELGLKLSEKWDQDEKEIGFEIPVEVVGLQWKDDTSVDKALKLASPASGKRSAAVTSFVWTRQSQGVGLDYETSNFFDYTMTIDVEALRGLGLSQNAKTDLSQNAGVISKGSVAEPDIDSSPDLKFDGTASEIKEKIIQTIVNPIPDDAIWLYPHTKSILVRDGKITVTFATDFEV